MDCNLQDESIITSKYLLTPLSNDLTDSSCDFTRGFWNWFCHYNSYFIYLYVNRLILFNENFAI